MGHEIVHESLITISQIRFTHTPATQWIFFSSKNAIKYFFAQKPEIKEHVKFGVMGPSSARYLLSFGKQADFTGSGVDVGLIAKEFAKCVGNETVLLPQAIDSLQSIQKQLSFGNTCSNLFVYKTTVKQEFEIPVADVLVFTSPSNARAYFGRYKLRPDQNIVAIGSSTRLALREFGVREVFLPDSFDEQGLLLAIKNALEQVKQEKEQ